MTDRAEMLPNDSQWGFTNQQKVGVGDFRMQQTFGERLRAARDLRGMSVESLAVVSGVNQYTIERLEENGHRRPERYTLERLATALGVHPKDLWSQPLPLDECGPLTCLECRSTMGKARGVCWRCRKNQKREVAEGKITEKELVRQGRLQAIGGKGLPWQKKKVNVI